MAWTEDRTAQLVELVGGADPVTQDLVAEAAEALEVSNRSIGAKLRKMNYNVDKATAKGRAFTAAQEDEITNFLNQNARAFTYAEVASNVCGGAFSSKQIQGKVLSLELTGKVKPTPKAASVKTYSDEEEDTIIEMANNGEFLEAIAEAIGRDLGSVRGKALSLLRTGRISNIPKQEKSHAKPKVDLLAEIENISEMTVAEIAEAIKKTERGVKVMLTHKGLACADYNVKKKKKAD
ncbi:MAG: hypothetical protein GY810_28390 [Aureispira sp.]|nr:hypothetical protein [Aureispira sp.]